MYSWQYAHVSWSAIHVAVVFTEQVPPSLDSVEYRRAEHSSNFSLQPPPPTDNVAASLSYTVNYVCAHMHLFFLCTHAHMHLYMQTIIACILFSAALNLFPLSELYH